MPRVNDSGIGWPVHLGQGRLIVERLQVRRAAGHVQVDDPLDLGCEMKRMNHAAPALGVACGDAGRFRLGPAEQARVEQRRQRQRAEPGRRAAQKRAAMNASQGGIAID